MSAARFLFGAFVTVLGVALAGASGYRLDVLGISTGAAVAAGGVAIIVSGRSK